jgi:hypothetical protein
MIWFVLWVIVATYFAGALYSLLSAVCDLQRARLNGLAPRQQWHAQTPALIAGGGQSVQAGNLRRRGGNQAPARPLIG